MKDSDFIDLANKVIDGFGSEHDIEALEAVMNDSTHRRLEYEQLSTVASILDAVRPIEPPEGLRNRILASLPLKAETRSDSWLAESWRSLVDAISARPQASLAYAVMGGLVVGIVGFGALSGSLTTDDSNVFGTLSSYSSTEGFTTVDEATISGTGLDADLKLVVSEEAFRVEITLLTESPTNVDLTVYPQDRKWAGFLRAEGSQQLDASLSERSIVLRGLESGRYALVGSVASELGPEGRIEITFQQPDGSEITESVEFR